ncbi:MAG: hypothetical protein IPG45_11265 [Deltaproteobacteria bacterium]|nr:hypothetical protein [Deltaproteobacteria bacterium]
MKTAGTTACCLGGLLLFGAQAQAQTSTVAASIRTTTITEGALEATASTTARVPRDPGAPNLVQVHRDERGFKLKVDGQDLMIFGMNWAYLPIGENHFYDFWGKPDAFIEAALAEEMTLLKEMGVNVIRLYVGVPQRWITYIYEKYGIYTVLNHAMGRYGFDRDGAYIPRTNYEDEGHRAFLKNDILQLVKAYQNTPGLLFWLLGNENNYGLFWKTAETEDLPTGQEADDLAIPLYTLYGEIIDEIHRLDRHHPVAIANGDLQFLHLIAQHVPNLDILGANVYRGRSSGDLFQRVEKSLGVPFVYTEFGSDAFNAKEQREDQLAQAEYLHAQWQEIYEQSYGQGRVGNAIGGVVFQWSDGWWKHKQEENLEVHDTTASWATGAYTFDFVDGENNMNEEWFGICAIGPPDASGHYRLYPRAAYYLLKAAFRLDPYAEGTTPQVIRAHFEALPPRSFTQPYDVQSTQQGLALLEMARVKSLTLQLYTFTSGGENLTLPERADDRFDHLQSLYAEFEVKPTAQVKATATVNVLGNVASNPIDEIFYENRGKPVNVLDSDQKTVTLSGVDRIQLYQSTFEWHNSYFDLDGYYRAGHGHWGAEGDFFGLYPEAYDQIGVDRFNAQAPAGFVFSGKRALKGLKVAFGPQLWWGANPTVIGKYYRQSGDWAYSLIHQEDIAQLASAGTGSVLPVPRTRKTALSLSYSSGNFKFELGGVMAGTDRLDRPYFAAREAEGAPSYLDSGYFILEDQIRLMDTLGGKLRVTYSGGLVNAYVQGGYRGLVADTGSNQVLDFVGWGLRESGQGNHYGGLAGVLLNLGGAWQIGPNFLYQKPIEGPLPLIADYFDAATGNFYPGVKARNQFDDPFWVRSNRETIGLEMLIGYDPTPGTWMWGWDAVKKENAPFAGMLDFTYRILPTSQDAGVSVSQEGFTFAFDRAPPAKNLWEVRGRAFINPTQKLRIVSDLYFGIAQSTGVDDRTVRRGGFYGRLIYEHLSVEAWLKINDWGPFDYHRDFNFTYPVQTIADVSYSLGVPQWFTQAYTRLGARGKFRTLDQYSNRIDLTSGDTGNEWEVMTYVIFGI